MASQIYSHAKTDNWYLADDVLLNANANRAWNIGCMANVPGMQGRPDRGLNLTSPRPLRLWTLPSTV